MCESTYRSLRILIFGFFVIQMVSGCSAKMDSIKDATDPLGALNNLGKTLPISIKESNQLSSDEVKNTPQKPAKQIVKGIYVSAWSAVGNKFEQLIDLVDQTDLNAMVIDIKNDSGQVTYPSTVPLVNEIGANSHVIIRDLKAMLLRLKEK
ncbi:putative glycoside hydrolase, partial [Paenibacillus sp. TAF58]